jgi:hypothetical protein
MYRRLLWKGIGCSWSAFCSFSYQQKEIEREAIKKGLQERGRSTSGCGGFHDKSVGWWIEEKPGVWCE